MSAESMEGEEKILTVLVEALLNRWGLIADERAMLLGNVDLKNFDASKRFNDDLKLRITQILFIHRCLRLRYPHDRKMVYGWIKAPSPDFGGKTPLETFLKNGDPDLLGVINYLERSKNYEDKIQRKVIALNF